MSLQPPVVPPDIRISQANLTDAELSYVVDLIAHASYNKLHYPPHWNSTKAQDISAGFVLAAQLRGIKDGVKVVTQTVDLRS